MKNFVVNKEYRQLLSGRQSSTDSFSVFFFVIADSPFVSRLPQYAETAQMPFWLQSVFCDCRNDADKAVVNLLSLSWVCYVSFPKLCFKIRVSNRNRDGAYPLASL